MGRGRALCGGDGEKTPSRRALADTARVFLTVDSMMALYETEKAELHGEVRTLRDQLESSQFASTAADSALQSSVAAQKEHIAALKKALDKVRGRGEGGDLCLAWRSQHAPLPA